MKKAFTVVGIGEVGSTIAALINSNFSDIILHLNDIQTANNGKVLDLQHAGACNHNLILYNEPNSLSGSDIIVFAAGFSNNHGESRNSVAEKNKELVRTIFRNIQLKPNVIILVITNPVEPVSHWINEITGGQYKVFGTGTALDTFRLKYLLQQKFACDHNLIKTLVVGEHGQNMVPLFSSTFIDGTSILDRLSSAELATMETELKQSAFHIRETEKATKFGVAETTLFVIKAILNEGKEVVPLSVPFKDSSDKKMYVSLPVMITNGSVTLIPFTMDEDEKEKFQAAIDSIAGNLE